MGDIPVFTIVEALIAIAAIIFYVIKLAKTRGAKEFDHIFSQSSPVTFLVFILMFGFLLIQINALELGAVGITKAIINFLAVVTVANMLSVMYYSSKKTNKK